MSNKHKKRKPREKKSEQELEQQKALDKKRVLRNTARLAVLVVTTALVFALYRFLISKHYFEYVLAAYTCILAAASLTYVIYNRGFSRKGITEDMLPDTMTQEQKQEFIEDGKRRLHRSRPLFIIIFAFAFTFIFDIIELFAVPLFKGFLGL